MRKSDKILNFLLVLAVLLGIFLWTTVSKNASADLNLSSAKISFLNVGQGDATLIQVSGNKQVLVDTGKKGTLLGELNSRMPAFDRKLEMVFLTHPDSDHIGSFEELVKSYEIEKLYYSWKETNSETAIRVENLVKEKNIAKSEARAGDIFYLGNLKLETLWPKIGLDLKENDSSIVLKAGAIGSRALLTGDVEIKALNMLVNSSEDLSADLLKLSHHGASGAYNEKFINKVGAKNAVISVGKNSYGHPGAVVLDGLKKLGISIYRTDELGTIDFFATDRGWVKR